MSMSKRNVFHRLPPLSALRGFESAARLNSFSKAAAELFMTQSAISHQIKLLEDHFGQPLFKRVNRSVEVTDAGVDFLQTTQLVLRQLQSGSNRLEFFNKPGLVVLTTPPTFASKWLMKKLHRLKDENKELDPWIYTTYDELELEHAEVDLAVWHGNGDWPGVEVVKLFDDVVTPLYAPGLLKEGESITDVKQLEDLPLIHVEQVERQEDWHQWFTMMGEPQLARVQGYNFNDTGMALDFALEGHGVVLATKQLAQHYLDNGQLIQPFEQELHTSLGYYLVFHPAKRNNKNVEKMRLWLLKEAGIPNEPEIVELDVS